MTDAETAALNAEIAAHKAEQDAAAYGFGALSNLMASLREACPCAAGTRERAIFLEQAYANVPLLVLASRLLHEHCQRAGRTRVLFFTRDGCVWRPIFHTLHPEYDVRTLVSSRRLHAKAPPAYVEYVRGMYCHENSVLVDMHGAGVNVSSFTRRHLDIEHPHVFVFSDCAQPTPNRAGILPWDEPCNTLEDLSADSVGSYVDLVDDQWVHAANEYPPWLWATVAAARDLAVSFIRDLDGAAKQSLVSGPDPLRLIRRLVAAVHEHCFVLDYVRHVDFH